MPVRIEPLYINHTGVDPDVMKYYHNERDAFPNLLVLLDLCTAEEGDLIRAVMNTPEYVLPEPHQDLMYHLIQACTYPEYQDTMKWSECDANTMVNVLNEMPNNTYLLIYGNQSLGSGDPALRPMVVSRSGNNFQLITGVNFTKPFTIDYPGYLVFSRAIPT